MALRITAIEILCVHCGAALLRTAVPAGKHRRCPFCGEFFDCGHDSTREMVIPETAVPFATDRKDFEREVLKRLARDERIPWEVFDSLSFTDAEGIYYPVRVPGEAEAGEKKRCRPVSGSKCLPEEVSGYITGHNYDLSDTERCTEDILDRRTFTAAEKDDAGNSNPGMRMVFLPFWVVTFRHGERVYRFVMDGTDSSHVIESMPRIPLYERPRRIMRKIAGGLQIAAWLSLILLFWNVYWIPMTVWALWIVATLTLRVQEIVAMRKDKTGPAKSPSRRSRKKQKNFGSREIQESK